MKRGKEAIIPRGYPKDNFVIIYGLTEFKDEKKMYMISSLLLIATLQIERDTITFI